jgi:Flp pilus assembly protein TadD
MAFALLTSCSAASSPRLAQGSGDPHLRAGGEPIPTGSAAASYLIGQYALSIGQIDTAASELQQALEAAPDDVDLRRQVFLLDLAGGHEEKAIAGARSLVETVPDADEAHLLLAFVATRDSQPAKATAELKAVSAERIGAVILPVLQAWAEFGQGQRDAALALLAAPAKSDNFGPLRDYHRAMMQAANGDDNGARQVLLPLVGPQQAAPFRLVEALVAIDARSGRRDEALGVIDAQLKMASDDYALTWLRTKVAAGQAPAPPARDARTGMADAVLSLAAALQEQQISAQALLYARMAALLTPDAGDVGILIGRIGLSEGNAQMALDAFDGVPKESAYSWQARLAAVQALAQLHRRDEAEARLRAMASEQPQRIEALVALGDMLRQDEKFALAADVYAQALSRIGEPSKADWRLLYAQGISLERTDHWPQAEAAFEKALKLDPDQPLVLNYLGYSWVDRGENLDVAKTMLNKAVELRPDDGFVVDSLGWAYYRLGEYGKAVTFLERAVELEPADPVINDHLGDAYWRAGRQREARFQWQRALTFHPETGAVAGIERKLQDGLPKPAASRG